MTNKRQKIHRTATTRDLCEQLDISKASVSRYCAAGMPHDGEGRDRRFDVAECAAWQKSQNKTGRPGRPAEPANEELQRLKCLKERVLIRKYERECAAAEARLVDVQDVFEKYRALGIELRRAMHDLPMRILSTFELDLNNRQKGEIDREICNMLDDVLRIVNDRMFVYTTPFAKMTLEHKPLTTEPHE